MLSHLREIVLFELQVPDACRLCSILEHVLYGKPRVSKDGKRRVTRKHSIKPAPVEAITAMRQLSETFSKVETPKLPPTNAPQTTQNDQQRAEGEWVQ